LVGHDVQMAAEPGEGKGAVRREREAEFPAGRELAGNFVNFRRGRQGISSNPDRPASEEI
jgi:hypothetical protein